MISMLVIFFIEFSSSRYLASIDEKVMSLQLRSPNSLTTIIEPVTNFLTRRKIIVNGKQVSVSAALALEVAEQAAETLLRVDLPEGPLLVERDGEVDEESGLLSHSDGDATKMDSTMRRGSHCGHHHYDPPPIDGSDYPGVSDATRKSQLLAVGIMEGGLCFHSIFVGLTLAVATGGGFVSLFIAIMFHRILSLFPFLTLVSNKCIEAFEGMGLGARIATLSFPRKSLRPYLMGLLFAVITPLGMSIGLSIRTLYSPTSTASLITTGVFDSISFGLLIYASLVELLAHEFLMGEMRFEGIWKSVFAGGCILAGATAMSFLGLWV